MKKAVIVVALLLLCANVGAVKIVRHDIEINISEEGLAHIIEKYALDYETITERLSFPGIAEDNGSSLLSWKADFDWFYPHFGGGQENIQKSYVSFDEKAQVLILDYFLKDEFSTLVREEAREVRWKILDKQLVEFLKSGLLVIPENVIITIKLPSNAEVAKHQLSEKARVVGNTVVLSGVSTNYINLQYTIEKPIAPSNFYGEFFKVAGSNLFLIIAVLVLLALGMYWKKKEITEKIENYIINHSELESGESEEEYLP